ncbi:helix-turn-helix domain-containing protein [Actinomadura rupiterrae]|uniref:helix-turn-helix domain-containing protein n=1 Tax=Actinomadura rupiterrae TaxID=559627 RepID=UPI0020A2B089|nr:helix-turn-helix transcriptional regulator [Actinomadura rupiterrae]MCP2343689.1 DNA-binding XRE family transcriptional regulator [Actinomadura rupiterrae]
MPAQRDPYASPAIKAFANELTAYRDQADLSISELAKILGYTPQFVGQVEACKNKPSKKFAEDCDTHFKTNGVFVRLWKNIDETQDLTTLPPGFTDYVGREALADKLHVYCALLVDGLFQVESYARAIISASRTGDVDDLVAKRMERGLILERENPPQVFLILDEGVVRRAIGAPAIMRDQLKHLFALSFNPMIQLQIVPYRTHYHPGLGGSLTILGFPDAASVGYTESAGIGVLVEQPEGVTGLAMRYDLLRGHALNMEESRAMIKDAMENYDRQAADHVAEE